MAFFAGKDASITFNGGAVLPMDAFTIDVQTEAIDTTNFNSSGYQENIAGIRKATISASGPYAGTSSLTDGTSGNFVLDTGGSGPTFTIPARITSTRVSTDVKGAARIEVTAESNGVFSITL